MTVDLRPYAKMYLIADVYVYAKALTETAKVFTNDRYIYAEPGDYLVCDDDLQDIYIVTQDIFDLLYERVDE